MKQMCPLKPDISRFIEGNISKINCRFGNTGRVSQCKNSPNIKSINSPKCSPKNVKNITPKKSEFKGSPQFKKFSLLSRKLSQSPKQDLAYSEINFNEIDKLPSNKLSFGFEENTILLNNLQSQFFYSTTKITPEIIKDIRNLLNCESRPPFLTKIALAFLKMIFLTEKNKFIIKLNPKVASNILNDQNLILSRINKFKIKIVMDQIQFVEILSIMKEYLGILQNSYQHILNEFQPIKKLFKFIFSAYEYALIKMQFDFAYRNRMNPECTNKTKNLSPGDDKKNNLEKSHLTPKSFKVNLSEIINPDLANNEEIFRNHKFI